MADSYHIIDGQVVPFHGGRKDTNTGAWRDATPLELQLQEQLAAAEEALAEAAAALEAAREDACVALVADIRFACGDNGKRMQPELVEFIRELAADAERYRFLRDDVRTNRAPHIYQYPAQSFDNPKLPHFKDVGLDAAIDQARGKGGAE